MIRKSPLRRPVLARWGASSGLFLSVRDLGQGGAIRLDLFRPAATVYELPLALTFDKSSLLQHLKMMRDRGGSDSTHRDDLAAVQMAPGRDRFEDHEPRFVGQGLRYSLNLRTGHID